jgi:N-methylhydantoinase B
MISTTMTAGERIYHKQAGGGGYGDPFTREPQAVARDVRNEKVSARAAREMYGVVVDGETGVVDDLATAGLRKRSA